MSPSVGRRKERRKSGVQRRQRRSHEPEEPVSMSTWRTLERGIARAIGRQALPPALHPAPPSLTAREWLTKYRLAQLAGPEAPPPETR